VQEVERLAEEKGPAAFELAAKAKRKSARQLNKWALPENQARDKKWLEKHGPDAPAWTPAAGTGRVAPIRRGVKPTWSRYLSRDKGVRVGKDGEKKKTRPDHFEALQVSIGQWARAEQLAGNELAADDLFDEYVSRLEDEQAKLQDPAASLSEKDKGWLKHLGGWKPSSKLTTAGSTGSGWFSRQAFTRELLGTSCR
jgi:hypothetical protein